MQTIASRRGGTLIDLLVTVFLLGVTGLIFSSAFPPAFSCLRQAREYRMATAIAQRKVEQLRSLNFESITPVLLLAGGVVDAPAASTRLTFTSVDRVDEELPGGVGILEIENAGPGLTRVTVTVSWRQDGDGNLRSTTLNTLFADRRTRGLN